MRSTTRLACWTSAPAMWPLRVLHDGTAVTGVSVGNPDGYGIVSAPSVILASGGLGHLYGATTNPEGSTGDGIALALWAGVAVSDLEFIQFHPTMLFAACSGGGTGGRRPLVTEAIRGEGAILLDRQGNSVTAGVHPMGDLAPRDVVAAAIDTRLKATGDACVFLDARGIEGFADPVPDRRRVRAGPSASIPSANPSRRAGGALQLRRHRHRRVRANRTPGAVCRGRGGPHRNARGQPLGV